ncbi:prepilin-type N-terminal cleavage/methylation domain-containing protein [Filibacter tadaridae]|nr:prepilin-type N-terminal cleavage/methylation domain-containing protein [Filibacter tadaridae]
MLNKFKKQMKNEKGMTLIELLAVIVIIAIIAAIAVPAIGGIISNTKDKALLADASNILAGAKLANAGGACTETTDATDATITAVECSHDVLKKYVENVKDFENVPTNFSAELKNNIWTVTYSGLSQINNEKYDAGTDKKITESELNELLNN